MTAMRPAEGGGSAALLGDIGATNARFALRDAGGAIGRVAVLACAEHAGLAEAIEAYLGEVRRPGELLRPRAVALDVAGPVAGDRIALTNHPWSFSRAELGRRLGAERLVVVNDFAAVAAAAPFLAEAEVEQLGGGAPAADAPIGVIGPGSGLGVGGILPAGGRWIALEGEGGHVSLPAATAREALILERLRRRFGHVSAERALSGPGLANLYAALSEIEGKPARPYRPAEISDPAVCAEDALCREAVETFAEMLGTVAGDLALTLGARGGVHIGGGIVPRLGAGFPRERFRRRFEEKGRLGAYLAPIPAFVIRHPFPAFVGLAALLDGRVAMTGAGT